MMKAGGQLNALSVASRLISLTKGLDITAVVTSLLASADPSQESTPLRVSTIADTWIHLSYIVQGGERNRALTIVKSRGTGHSNQVRELLLTSEGIRLADVYSSGGAVLMGTQRWEREQQEQNEEIRRRTELERKRRELSLALVEANARIEILKREAEARGAELDLLDQHEEKRGIAGDAGQAELRRRRGADEARPS
jgi:circadian clock protein KaiC